VHLVAETAYSRILLIEIKRNRSPLTGMASGIEVIDQPLAAETSPSLGQIDSGPIEE
jgi:hypothetical protein